MVEKAVLRQNSTQACVGVDDHDCAELGLIPTTQDAMVCSEPLNNEMIQTQPQVHMTIFTYPVTLYSRGKDEIKTNH